MNKNRGLTPLAVVLMLSGSLALIGCDNKQAQQGGQQMPEVGVVTLKTGPLQITTELPGHTNAFRIAEVHPQVSGIILKHNFTEGGDIKAGVSLYQIDPATYQAAYESAKGDLAKAQTAADIAQLTVKRYQKLLGTKYINQQDYDNTQADAQQANAAVVATRAAVETAHVNLAYTRVTLPINSCIGKSSVTEGALVQSDQATALTTVQQSDPIYVDVAQPSNDFLRLEQELANDTLKQGNDKAKVELMTNDGIKFPQSGTPEFSDVTVGQTIGSVTLCTIFPSPNHTLLPGVFVRVRLEEGINSAALLVPQQGVTRTPRDDASALVVGTNNEVETHQIVAARAVGDKWLITDGLKPGDRIIVTGLQKVCPGAQVKAQEITADNNRQDQNDSQPEQSGS